MGIIINNAAFITRGIDIDVPHLNLNFNLNLNLNLNLNFNPNFNTAAILQPLKVKEKDG